MNLNKIYVDKVLSDRFLKISNINQRTGEKEMRLFDMKLCQIVPNFKFKSEWCVLIVNNT